MLRRVGADRANQRFGIDGNVSEVSISNGSEYK
jgi:hypothetical protein